uniref:Uncharacterized protein n=1 Tax=Physcomitrium patens TaxID=3218 RepID=A0A2K1JDA3_PHYPA|nr:hypothetical protein PHYPA_019792 [Physcomitrium patens]
MKYLQLEPTHPPRKAHSERGRIFVSFGAQLDVKARFCYALVVNLLGLKVNCTVVSCGSVVPELDLGFGLSHAMRLVVRMGFLLPVLLMLMNRSPTEHT